MTNLTTFDLLFKIHLASCLLMTGLIWVIQIVHYPSFERIAEDGFPDFVRFHGMRISMIVMPLMILELITGVALAAIGDWNRFWLVNLLGIVLIWLSTFFLSVPCHRALGSGFDLKKCHKLVLTNWPRTGLWSMRAVALFLWF